MINGIQTGGAGALSYSTAVTSRSRTGASGNTVCSYSGSASSATSNDGIGIYDFTDMTPNQMKSAARALAASGKINAMQAFKMKTAGIPLGTLVDGKFEPLTAAQQESFANSPVDYIQLFQSNMAFLQQQGLANDPKSGYADDQAILTAMTGAQGNANRVDISV